MWGVGVGGVTPPVVRHCWENCVRRQKSVSAGKISKWQWRIYVGAYGCNFGVAYKVLASDKIMAKIGRGCNSVRLTLYLLNPFFALVTFRRSNFQPFGKISKRKNEGAHFWRHNILPNVLSVKRVRFIQLDLYF